ncbi:MAG: DUF3822 family protein [Vicingaceae bacterium]
MANTPALQKRFIDQSYESKLSQLELYLNLSKQYLQALYYSPADKQFVGFEEYYLGDNESWSLALDPIRLAVQEFSGDFKRVQLCLSTPIYTHIPTVLFIESVAENYLLLNHKVPVKSSEVKSNEVSSLQLTVAYEFPFLIENVFQAHFNLSGIHHESVALLEYFSAKKKREKNEVYLHVQYHHFHLVQFNENGLVFYNRFEYSTVEDFMYYLLYAFEQLKIDRESVNLLVFGELEEESSVYKMLYKYVRKLNIEKRPKSINESQVLSQLGESHFFNLFNQYLCES